MYQWRAFARDLEPDHPSLLLDYNPATLAPQSQTPLIRRFHDDFPELYMALIKALRIRRMAAQTEKSYLARLVRFFQFHQWQDIDTSGDNKISEYLE